MIRKNEKLKEACDVATDSIRSFFMQAKPYILPALSKEEQKSLKYFFLPENTLCQKFFNAFDRHATAGIEIKKTMNATLQFLQKVPTADPQAVEDEKPYSTVIANLTDSHQKYATNIATYMPIGEEFAHSLSARIASSENAQVIEALYDIVKNRNDIMLLTKYGESLQILRRLTQETEKHINNLQDKILQDRAKEIKHWYDTLIPHPDDSSPNSGVSFDIMEPGHEKTNIYALSYGEQMSAPANLSECQLNCLGLAVWGSCAPLLNNHHLALSFSIIQFNRWMITTLKVL
ncbi:hypothetical protein Q7M33_02775 [Candidatus Liberibacter asiaticus]